MIAACGDTAVVLTIDSDLAIPADLDGMCLAVADSDLAGGEFARFYPLGADAEVSELPQTLTVAPGGASAAQARLRGYRNGIEVARDLVELSFGGGVSGADLLLSACAQAGGGAPSPVSWMQAPLGTRVVASSGRGGTVVVAVGAGFQAALVGAGGNLVEADTPLPALAVTEVTAMIAFDADGDCDDDVVVVPADGPPQLLLRTGVSFGMAPDAFAGAGLSGLRAIAAADVDGDADVDLVLGGGGVLQLLRNGGTGRFQADVGAIPAAVATDVTALALGDVDGDGHVDLVIGQGDSEAAANQLLLNDASGGGFFEAAPAVLPATPARTRALALVDIGLDGYLDLVVGGLGSPLRLYVNRGDGRLEDRSFVTLPATDVVDVTGLAAGRWDGDCLRDVVVARAGSALLTWLGSDTGVLSEDDLGDAPVAETVLMVDVDDDGVRDLLVAGGGEGVGWVRR